MARPTCLYCGAPLPEAEPAPAPAPEPPPADDGRALVLLDLRGADVPAVSEVLGLSTYEARQRVSGGGWQLHRVLPHARAEEEAGRLSAAGLAVLTVPAAEAAARARPLQVRGGDGAHGLRLRTDEGSLLVQPDALFLIVRGPITREYQTATDLKRVRSATLEGGHRIHLHRHDDPRPLELDSLAFDFGDAALPSLSSLLTLMTWLEEEAPRTPVDEGFRRFTPALAPARADAVGRLQAADALRAPRRGSHQDGPLVLDNVEQFRAYSGWRAAIELRSSSH
ncbi:MAG TPA: hypothetical protein VFQ51_12765 [Vicinamibacteria bacterium]|nr:hypothetical protein [Vicinamibacteria bacterium]